MRLRTVRLVQFKRFDDLTIDLGPNPAKIVALVGPNGSGKSAVFDAFEQVLQDHVGVNSGVEPWFLSKAWYDATQPVRNFNKRESIQLTAADGSTEFQPNHFYVRSAYRFTPSLRVDSIKALGDMVRDSARPGSSIALDQRLQSNYERLLGRLLSEFWSGTKTGAQTREELVGRINQRLSRVLDIHISDLGDVSAGKGQLFFEKGNSKDFPFENLSAGEKEVVNMLIDLEVKLPVFNDTVYCIDEPELHLNTAIQRSLLNELAELVPDTCQLWVATHSVGFLRALQKDQRDNTQVLDLSEQDYFNGEHTICPIVPSRGHWKRIFRTALEDLTGLIAPEIMIYCEGRADPAADGAEQGLDAQVYNEIFDQEFPDVQFMSSGGGGAAVKNVDIALKVLSKAFDSVELLLLKDRDERTAAERDAFLAESASHRMLQRREVENYLFDWEVLQRYGNTQGRQIDEGRFRELVHDIELQDLKQGQTLQQLTHLAAFQGTVRDFKLALAATINQDMGIYTDLKACIFHVT